MAQIRLLRVFQIAQQSACRPYRRGCHLCVQLLRRIHSEVAADRFPAVVDLKQSRHLLGHAVDPVGQELHQRPVLCCGSVKYGLRRSESADLIDHMVVFSVGEKGDGHLSRAHLGKTDGGIPALRADGCQVVALSLVEHA